MVIFKLIILSIKQLLFQLQKSLPKWCQRFVKIEPLSVKKLKILWSLDHTTLFKLHQHVVQILSRNVWKDFRLPISASAIVYSIKYPIRTSIFAVNLALKLPRVTVADANIGSLKFPHAGEIWTNTMLHVIYFARIVLSGRWTISNLKTTR